jgi:hypothetical protein
MTMLQNREEIIDYITFLKAVNVEVCRGMETCFNGFEEKWHQLRFDRIYGMCL